MSEVARGGMGNTEYLGDPMDHGYPINIAHSGHIVAWFNQGVAGSIRRTSLEYLVFPGGSFQHRFGERRISRCN